MFYFIEFVLCCRRNDESKNAEITTTSPEGPVPEEQSAANGLETVTETSSTAAARDSKADDDLVLWYNARNGRWIVQ